MELVDQFRGVFQEFHRFPGELIITNPVDKVFHVLMDNFGIKYLYNLKLNVVVNDY